VFKKKGAPGIPLNRGTKK